MWTLICFVSCSGLHKLRVHGTIEARRANFLPPRSSYSYEHAEDIYSEQHAWSTESSAKYIFPSQREMCSGKTALLSWHFILSYFSLTTKTWHFMSDSLWYTTLHIRATSCLSQNEFRFVPIVCEDEFMILRIMLLGLVSVMLTINLFLTFISDQLPKRL